jgi:hypothetical protein
MSLLAQQWLAGMLVLGCALFAAWRLLSVALRLRTLDALGKLPGVARRPWLARLRARLLARQSSACGGCAPPATPDAASRNRTPGALRR